MEDTRYCPTCGKRIIPPDSTRTYTVYGTAYTVKYYLTNHTEPICPGHSTRLSINASASREAIPQAFYDAFKEEEHGR